LRVVGADTASYSISGRARNARPGRRPATG
jgi:hypothetical protein